MNTELEKFYKLVNDIDICMMVTKRTDGHLVSRAMSTLRQADGADLWFVTGGATGKVHELEHDQHVNLAYYHPRTREWISVSGLAKVSHDRAKIKELYAPDWKAWFPEEGDPRHGTPEDPRIVLIGVDIHAAAFWEVNKPQPVVLFEIFKGMLTGSFPNIGEMHTINETRDVKP